MEQLRFPRHAGEASIECLEVPVQAMTLPLIFRGGGKLSIDHLISHFSAH